MLTDFGDDMHCQFLEILRSLLEPFTPGSQRENLVEIFYEKHFGQLIDAITSSCCPNSDVQIDSKSVSSDGESRDQSMVTPEILLNICDLLCFCVAQHSYRIKCNFLLNNVIDKVLYLTRRREKYLVLAAIRFVRALISRSDEHLMNHFVTNNLLKPIIDAFIAKVLELFEYIRKENLKVLLRYLVDTFWDHLVKFESLSPIQALKVKYEQLLESTGTKSAGGLLDQRKRLDERALEKEEEDYFNEDSDEEDSASARTANTNRAQVQPPVVVNGSPSPNPSPRSGGLVDYDDDEDDEDYKPPPKKTTDASDEEEGLTEFPLKRKLVSKEEPEAKRQRSAKVSKPREGVFASLCSTLSGAVLPSKKVATASQNSPPSNVNQNSVEPHPKEDSSVNSSSRSQSAEVENQSEKTDGSNDSTDNTKRDDKSIPPWKASPDMAVNGS
ncbi:hypothetical protein CDL12_14515 [Handroanthus impetiginosus]|uniref:Serine/threonine-protein phosphatase 4 regulatory subunit 3-like central domain-containing protein n=1 Tax=Handroanthus impetiginosus TaxID=429701 RepID=A0A2G9H5R9_9LAMI|nr:hypothetical protein CDL12_14515 [Handroanthus impetiginosus]